MLTYIIGAIGYRVFANFSGGYEVFPRPTSGYLIGLIAMLW
jgi:biotin transporter BioY